MKPNVNVMWLELDSSKNMGSMGRGLIASKEFKKGDRILKDKSVVSYKADEVDYI